MDDRSVGYLGIFNVAKKIRSVWRQALTDSIKFIYRLNLDGLYWMDRPSPTHIRECLPQLASEPSLYIACILYQVDWSS